MAEMHQEKPRDQIAEAIADFVRQSALDVRDGAADTDSLEYLDSIEVLRLISFVESTFGIQVEDADVRPENFDTVQAIARYIEAKRSAEFRGD